MKRKLFESQNVSLYRVTKDLGLETKRIREKAIVDVDVLEGILKEVK